MAPSGGRGSFEGHDTHITEVMQLCVQCISEALSTYVFIFLPRNESGLSQTHWSLLKIVSGNLVP